MNIIEPVKITPYISPPLSKGFSAAISRSLCPLTGRVITLRGSPLVGASAVWHSPSFSAEHSSPGMLKPSHSQVLSAATLYSSSPSAENTLVTKRSLSLTLRSNRFNAFNK